MSNPRDELTDDEGRAFLCWPKGYAAPPEAELVADARAIIQTNMALNQEVPRAPVHMFASPVWHEHRGKTIAKMALLPPMFSRRYFEGAARAALTNEKLVLMVCDFVHVFADDPVGATFALEDTHSLWWDESAPTKDIASSYKPHFKLLSLLLADTARKSSAGFNGLEVCASWGGLRLVHDAASHPPAEAIKSSMRAKAERMRVEEDDWKLQSLR